MLFHSGGPFGAVRVALQVPRDVCHCVDRAAGALFFVFTQGVQATDMELYQWLS